MFKTKKSVVSLVLNLSAVHLQTRCASNVNRESRMLQKLMSGKKKAAFKWSDQHAIKKSSSIFDSNKKPTKITTRRSIVLNKLFMRHVTELISSGPIGFELSGLGLEITRVNVCQNYHGLNIYWTATGSNDFDYVEQKLASINKPLRHELHQMQLMGNTPHLTFVRDEQVSYFDALDAAMSKADYGEDYEPSLNKTKRKNDFETQGYVEEGKSDGTSSQLPMRHDVFGLDHALIMGRIKQSLAKSKQAWKAFENKQTDKTPAKPFSINTSFESIRQDFKGEKQSAEILKEFLQNRKLMRKQKRAEQAEFRAQIEEDLANQQTDEGDFDDSADWNEDENEIQKFYDEYESMEK